MIGRLRRVPLREVWKHEALDFTRWLEQNIDIINEVANLSLSDVQREQAAGAFSVDLVAEDGSGNLVIIENQLERSDHDHLGKLITYLTAFEAKTAIWIVADPRPEHITAITWLNQSTPASFYLMKVEAVRIGDSPPAPLLTLIVAPSAEGRAVGETKQELAGQQAQLLRFWADLLDRSRQRTLLHADATPTRGNWLPTRSSLNGAMYAYVILARSARVELYIDCGDEAKSQLVFDHLYANKDQIEHETGTSLRWNKREGRRVSKIEFWLQEGGYLDEDKWPNTQDAMIVAMIRLEQAMKPHLEQIHV